MTAHAPTVPPDVPPLVLPLDEHNRRLLENVHPPGWLNPQPLRKYDLVVIGAGAGGLVSALGAAGVGARVALVEKHLLGGDCLNVGCVPSKAMIRSARAVAEVRDAAELGIRVPGNAVADFSAVMERMRRLRARISPNDGVKRLRDAGVHVFLGHARFVSRDAVEVEKRTLRFKRAIVAAGARPAEPGVPGLQEAGYLTNETVFWLTELPRRLAIIGGGPIGCELAQAFGRFGSRVHLIEKGPRVLPREDAEAASLVEAALRRDGVGFHFGCRVVSARRCGDEKALTLSCEAGESELHVDEILAGVGRQPNVEDLGLGAAGVAYDARRGVTVDDRLRTSNRRVFAVGDVCSRFKFTHAADAMARLAVRNALFFGRGRFSRLTIPWCTYTDPEVAHVGLYEHEARERGYATDTIRLELSDIDRAVVDGEDNGFLKVVVKKGSDRVLGATLVARHAGEMISHLTLAIKAGVGLNAISDTIFPYPTQAEIIRKAGDAYNRSRLTPMARRLLGLALALHR